MEPGKKQNSERTATLILLFGQVLAAIGAFLVNLLASRVLDPNSRGDLAFALQIAYIFTVLAVMGLERPFIAFRSGPFYSEYRTFVRMIMPGALAVVPLVVIAVVLLPFSRNWLWAGALVVAIYVLLNAITRGVRVAYVVSKNWKSFAFNAIATQIIIVIGAVLLVVLEVHSPMMWMCVYAASTIPSVLLLLPVLKDDEKSVPPSKEERKELRRRGWVLLPSEFSNTAMLRSDRLLLPVLSTSAELGLYVTVATVLEMSTWPIKQWVDASLRRWTKSGSKLTSMMGKILIQAFLFLLIVTSLMAVAAYLMIIFFLPDVYMRSLSVIIPLAIASIIYGLTRVQQGLLIALGFGGRVSIVEILGTIVSIIFYIFLMPSYGMLGAAYGSIAGYLVGFLVSTVILLLARKAVR